MIQVDPNKKPMSIVFVGHVDAGKSTISGNLLYKLGQIDERIIEKYQREAKVKNRESWFMAYIMDINEEEREKGKTIEIGKAFFETPHKRFTLLDAPGHSGYIPNLLQGACQADFAGLVISAKKGEFEAGFDKSGSTREHTLLLKALGVNQLIVIVNKMDEESVKWSEERYMEIKTKLTPFLKSCGYDIDNYVHWIPLSGLNGDNLVKPIDSHKCSWYKGPYFTELLDQIEVPNRDDNGPVRLPILDRYKENALYIMGKLESGTLKYGETYTLMPTKAKVTIDWLLILKKEEFLMLNQVKMLELDVKELIMKLKLIEVIFYAQMIIFVMFLMSLKQKFKFWNYKKNKLLLMVLFVCYIFILLLKNALLILNAKLIGRLKLKKKLNLLDLNLGLKLLLKLRICYVEKNMLILIHLEDFL